MKTTVQKFIAAVRDYFEAAFSARVNELNQNTPDLKMQDIALWSSGYSGVTAGLSAYPGCLILVNGRTLLDAFTTQFSVVIGLGITSDDPERLELLGGLWEDILEDAIRSDWHLGGACLDTDMGIAFQTDCVNNVYLIQAAFTCMVDLGGFVYEAKDEAKEEIADDGKEEQGTVVQVSEMSSDVRPV